MNLIKRISLSLICLLCTNFIINAQKGIRVESHDTPVVVYIDNNQMCTPVYSCFISNLNMGRYQVDVYTEKEHRILKGKLIFSKKIHYMGGIEEIKINSGGSVHRPPVHGNSRMMDEKGYREFYASMKAATFDSNRTNLLTSVLSTTDFTSEQAEELSKLYDFDSAKMEFMKKIYPNIVDKRNFYMAINTLTFDSDRNRIAAFVEDYHKKEAAR